MKRCVLGVLVGLAACATSAAPPPIVQPAPLPPEQPGEFSASFGSATPEHEGLDSAALAALTDQIRASDAPIYSVLVSRDGKLVYEMYTSGLGRDEAHYLMSVTKSFTSALIGIAVDHAQLPDPATPIAQIVPRDEFPDDDSFARFGQLTLTRVMGMAGIDAPDPPRDNSPPAVARQHAFWRAHDRLRFILGLPILAEGMFLYDEYSANLAADALQAAAGKPSLELARGELFEPLGFRNYEWMHRAPATQDNGAVGLRLRPIDMQKFGVLYLAHGMWNGAQLISRAWVERSFTPWNKSRAELPGPNYGWFWWQYDFGDGWIAHVADGWKGQRIAVFPAQRIVLTMTGCFEDNRREHSAFVGVVHAVRDAVRGDSLPDAPAAQRRLADAIAQVRGANKIVPTAEWRMVPTVAPKEPAR